MLLPTPKKPKEPCNLAPAMQQLDVNPFDIGLFYQKAKIPDAEKYLAFNNCWKPDPNFVFPVSIEAGKNRSFLHSWLQQFPWLAYSESVNGAFCKICIFFGNLSSCKNAGKLNKLLKSPYTYWTGAKYKFTTHQNSQIHQNALLSYATFEKIMQQKAVPIDVCMNRASQKIIEDNRKKLIPIIETVILCGRQNFALRGHRDDATNWDKGNPGNFQSLLNYRVKGGDTILKDHFQRAPKNATYRSKSVQNELIQCCADFIRNKLTTEIKKAKYFSVLADEANDYSNKEQMSFIIRFVDENDEIREEFLEFVHCPKGIKGEQICELIKETVENLGLDMRDCRGQGYDGAGNMAGKYIGAAALIKQDYKSAVYVHCAAHRLNLCVVAACKIQMIKNMMNTIQRASQFFSNSPKRQSYLEKNIKSIYPESVHTKLIDVCRTRWIERIDGIVRFEEMMAAIIETWQEMKLNEDDIFNTETSTDAAGLYTKCRSFEFIIALVVTRECFYRIRGATILLQARNNMDIMKGYTIMGDLKTTLIEVRDNIETYHHEWFIRAEQLAKEINTNVDVPRLCGMQTLRENYNVQTPEEYYRVSISVPFLDHLITQLDARFSTEQLVQAKGFALIPQVMKKLSMESPEKWKEEVRSFLCHYILDVPHPLDIEAELDIWKVFWDNKEKSCLPDRLYKTLKEINPKVFPNIHTALKILATLPITTCEAERSISVIRRLKAYLRSTMTQTRFNGLALLHVHQEIDINTEEVLDMFARKHSRRMQMVNILDSDKNDEQDDSEWY